MPLDSWYELVLANALYDQAGFVLLSDVHQPRAPSGPWKRALAKVDKEETFHLRHGRTWVKKLCRRPGREGASCRPSLDWMFILTLEWFGLPDARKRHGIQLEYGFKGKTNDELRQDWMGDGRAVHGGGRARRAGALRRGRAALGRSTARSRARSTPRRKRGGDDGDPLGRGDGPLEGPRADERDYVARLQKGYRG